MKKKSCKGKKQYPAYASQDRAKANKQRKLAKHKKAHPNDLQAQAVKSASGHTRKAPKTKGNFPEPKNVVFDGAGRPLQMPYRLTKAQRLAVEEAEKPFKATNEKHNKQAFIDSKRAEFAAKRQVGQQLCNSLGL